ncbi:MAG: polysulfide reductase NrfD [Candidatus Latescibacteria bacterium]|jgi:Fe-S-cluster-containing dehydrogenase component/formate-dependent nitrite reductase membrane component NrfD|nr:polysulfide reductase NrfD [Candidatus Latescibacterota bacterium]
MNYGFIIDNRKCIGCHACTVACKSEHDVSVGVNRTWVKYVEKGAFPDTRRLFSVMRCNHCEDAPCVEICPTTALYTRDDGIVDFDPRRCIGCKGCMQACPYDALYIDPETETAAKCNYCAHRVDIGLEPACVNVCPEHAIISGDMANPDTEISGLLAREQVTVRKADKGTKPKLFYIEGDESTLNPTSTEPSSDYMWSSQSTGVGHFAKYAEDRISHADPIQMARLLAAQGSIDDAHSENEIIVPPGEGMSDHAEAVKQENAQRVYDAPGKGILWGWEVTAYVWTKGIAAGAFLVPFLAMVFNWAQVSQETLWLGAETGLLFLLFTTILLVMDLDQPRRFLYVLLRPQWRSWLTLGGYALTIYGALLTLWCVAMVLNRSALAGGIQGLAALFAVITAVYTAFLFAQAKGRDFWQSPTLSLHMIVHSVMAGAAIFAIFGFFTGGSRSWYGFLTDLIYISIIVNILVLLFELITTHSTAAAKQVVSMILTGRYSVSFCFGVVLIGNVLPLWCVWLGGTTSLAVAGICILIGIYITEHIWVRAPQTLPLS